MPGLFDLRPWLALDEAAKFLSERTRLGIGTADIMRLALDGELELSVNLPAPVQATIMPREGQTLSGRYPQIQGIFGLPMEGAGRIEIESHYALARHGDYVPASKTGAIVEQGDFRYLLPPDRGETGIFPRSASALPQGSQLVVLMPALLALAEKLEGHSEPSETIPERPLGTRERESLLIVIAALASKAGLSVDTPSKTALVIEAETESLGRRVGQRTIERHLNAAVTLIRQSGRSAK